MGGRRVSWLPGAEAARRALVDRLDHNQAVADGAILVTVGAGDVHKLGESLLGDGG
jgi:hypothetical protein